MSRTLNLTLFNTICAIHFPTWYYMNWRRSSQTKKNKQTQNTSRYGTSYTGSTTFISFRNEFLLCITLKQCRFSGESYLVFPCVIHTENRASILPTGRSISKNYTEKITHTHTFIFIDSGLFYSCEEKMLIYWSY